VINARTGKVDRAARAAATPPKPCSHCGKPMPRLLHHTDERWQDVRFCSVSCAGKVYGKRPRPGIFMRLDARLQKGGPEDCWFWQGASSTPSGPCYISGKLPGAATRTHAVHRVAYVQEHGPIPAGGVVRHTCGSMKCCNPAHLVLEGAEDAGDVLGLEEREQDGPLDGPGRAEAPLQLTPQAIQQILAAYRALPKTDRGYALPGAMPALAQQHGLSYLRLLRLLKKYGESRLNYVDKD